MILNSIFSLGMLFLVQGFVGNALSPATMQLTSDKSMQPELWHIKSPTIADRFAMSLIALPAADKAFQFSVLDRQTTQQMDGQTLRVSQHDAGIAHQLPSRHERLLDAITNPDLDVLLLVIGLLLIYVELNAPAAIVPGALGTLLLLLGVYGLSVLPISATALLLISASGLLIALNLKVASNGILSVLCIFALVLGFKTLVEGSMEEVRVHWGTAFAVGLGLGVTTLLLTRVGLAARRNKALMGPASMIGRQAVVLTVNPCIVQVEIRGEIWQAQNVTPSKPLCPGNVVVVRGVTALLLVVVEPTS